MPPKPMGLDRIGLDTMGPLAMLRPGLMMVDTGAMAGANAGDRTGAIAGAIAGAKAGARAGASAGAPRNPALAAATQAATRITYLNILIVASASG